MENRILVILGKSGAGKDKISKYISENFGYNFIKSVTTRPMRPNESQGNPYYFITYNEFLELIDFDRLVEYREYNTNFGVWYYGVRKSDIVNDKKYVVVLDVQGLLEFKNNFKDRVYSIYIDVNDDTRESRSIARGGHDSLEWERRRIDDEKVFKDVNKVVDLTVENYSFKDCVGDILQKINKVYVDELEV